MKSILHISWESILADLPAFMVIAIWNLFLILFLSKKSISNFSTKGRSISSSVYFSRKVIHFLAG